MPLFKVYNGLRTQPSYACSWLCYYYTSRNGSFYPAIHFLPVLRTQTKFKGINNRLKQIAASRGSGTLQFSKGRAIVNKGTTFFPVGLQLYCPWQFPLQNLACTGPSPVVPPPTLNVYYHRMFHRCFYV